MANFEALPGELLARVIGFLDKKSLAQMRLVNKRLEQISVERLFAKITLYAHWKKISSYTSGEEVTDLGYSGRADAGDEARWTDKVANHRIHEYDNDGVEVRDVDQLLDNGMSGGALELDHVALASHERMPTIAGRRRAVGNFADDPNSDEDPPSSSVSRSRSPVGGRRRHSTIPSRSTSPPRRRRDTSSPPPRRRIDERSRTRTEEAELSSDDSISLEDAEEDLDKSGQRWLRVESRPTSRCSAACRMPQWASNGLPGPPYDAHMFKNILQDVTLKRHVKEVQIYTCNTDCDFHPVYAEKWYRGEIPEPEFDPIYNQCIGCLAEFPNLRNITVHFDRHTSGNHSSNGEIFQDRGFQPRWLSQILCSVDTCKHINELAIRHYENTSNPHLNIPMMLIATVARLTALRLSIKHEETNRLSVGPTYRCGNIHPFWDMFPARFLEPPQQDLTTLVLYSDLPLGWFPKLDLRKIHFPKLRSLTLGQHMFHDYHQVKWIMSHKSTLKELYLDCCSILYQIGHAITGWLDEEGYPKGEAGEYDWSFGPEHVQDEAEFSRTLQFVSIGLRWHEIFAQFTEELHVLEDFKFGSSKQWKMDIDSRYIEQGCQTGGLPIMPWEDEKNIENQILETRYMIWDDMEQIYRPKWTSDAGVYNNNTSTDRLWRDEWKARFEPYPHCKEADETALQTLLEKIKGN